MKSFEKTCQYLLAVWEMPQEIADLIVFSNEASFITGSDQLDGGFITLKFKIKVFVKLIRFGETNKEKVQV